MSEKVKNTVTKEKNTSCHNIIDANLSLLSTGVIKFLNAQFLHFTKVQGDTVYEAQPA